MRRFALLLVVLAGCAPADPPAVPKPDRTGTDWPTFLGPNADNSSPDKGILTAWPKDGLKKVWECRLGDGYAPPVVADGRLFHFDRFDDDLVLTARNAETGKKLWEYKTPTDYDDLYGYEPGPRACPVIDGERVYAFGPDGQLVCVTAGDGKEVWKLDTRKAYHVHQNFFGVGSVPLVVGELLIVAVGGSPDGKRPLDLRDAKGNGSGLVAFDKKTGKEKWKATDELASYSSPVLATFHDKKTVLYFARGGLIGVDPENGKERFSFAWRAKMQESVNAANPVVVGDTILLTECYEKGAVLVKVTKDFKVETVWSDDEAEGNTKALRGHWCTPVVDGKYVYGSSGRHEPEGDVRCVELATGEVKWKHPRTRRSTITKVDGHLIVLTEDGTLMLVKPTADKFDKVAEWAEKDNPDLRSPCWAPPVVARGLMYVRGKGKLCCYELIPSK
jgi:outer membrane protein assembly factor BamB